MIIGEKTYETVIKIINLTLLVAPCVLCVDKNDGDDDRGCVYPNPSQPSESIYNYTGEVEFVVDAPQIKEKIEQDLTENPPFGGAKKYQILVRKVSSALAATYTLNVQDTKDETSFYSYRMSLVDRAEWKENYKLFPVGSGISGSWYKWDIVPIATGDGKAIATYDVFIKQDIPASLVGSKMYFCEDLTEKCRQKFPQDDIHAVVRRLVLSYVKGGDVVKD